MRGLAASAALLLVALATGAAGTQGSERSRSAMSPITRCVELLKGIAKKIQEDEAAEEAAYEKFVCWGKQVISAKEASNAAAQNRIGMLNTYISDLDGDRIELTTERVDLEKEIEELSGDLNMAETLRDKEHQDFVVAEGEMMQAVDALRRAMTVLRQATEAHKEGVLASLRASVDDAGGFAERSAEAAALNRAVELGDKFLTKGDAIFLRRLLTGQVPRYDWKKLNRKATFKMSYKARSLKIQDVLSRLLSTFSTNLADARSKEAEAVSNYEEISKAKKEQLNKAKEALEKMAVEGGARGMSKAEAQAEVDALTAQLSNDRQYIADVQKAMDEKKVDWKNRKNVRAEELKAISEAIAILHHDDAKDLFKRSYASQGLSLLQVAGEGAAQKALAARARAAVREAGVATLDSRLVSLAGNITEGTHLDAVIQAIDKMVGNLQSEEAEDLKNKEDCESTRADDTRASVVASRAIDDMTDAITHLQSEIKEIGEQIDKANEELQEIAEQMASAKRIREDERAAWAKSDKDDQDAAQTVSNAIDVLEGFYKAEEEKDSDAKQEKPTKPPRLLLQLGQVPAGEAPPPPPATWETSYTGLHESSKGVLQILAVVVDDIEADRERARKAEEKAEEDYTTAYNEFVAQRNLLTSSVTTMSRTKGRKESEVVSEKTNRATKKGELDSVLEKIKHEEPGCNYITINYALRAKNRQVEMDGLLKAKAILSGASFATPPDPNRVLRPGDAFLQRTRRH